MEKQMLDNIESISLDGIESLTDIILSNEIIEKIPIANVASAIIKTGEMIYNKNLLKQTTNFIESLNGQEVSKEKLEKYRKKFLNDELERVLLYLNKNIDIEKSRLLAKFYVAYVNEEIKWEKFCEFASVINQIFIDDLTIIYNIYKDEPVKVVIYESYKISRLMAIGLLSNYSGAITVQELSSGKTGVREIYEKNELGELFVKIATKEEVKKLRN